MTPGETQGDPSWRDRSSSDQGDELAPMVDLEDLCRTKDDKHKNLHPYMDGNGRMGRFLMNLMMAAGGYPCTVIPVAQRKAYVAALEKASVGEDIAPFADFLAGVVEKRLAGGPCPKFRRPKRGQAATNIAQK